LAAGFFFQDGHRRKTGRAIEPAGQDDLFVKSMRLAGKDDEPPGVTSSASCAFAPAAGRRVDPGRMSVNERFKRRFRPVRGVRPH